MVKPRKSKTFAEALLPKSPVTVRVCESGIRVMMLLLLQIREETVRFVASIRLEEEIEPPMFTVPLPSALVLPVSRLPELSTVAPV